MCTVTYIPGEKNQFTLTSNRDENATRSPQNITQIEQNGLQLVFPRDTMAGGTWIAVSNNGKVVCLLNGAFDKHQHQPPYKKSRGIMVLEYFTFDKAESFFQAYNFEGMEPFTMIIYDQSRLFEFRWDEARKHITPLDKKGKHIWSSSTLYDQAVKAKRKKWFSDWLEQRTDFSSEAILDFHQNAGEGDPRNDVIMNRNNIVQTVSITQITKSNKDLVLSYYDLLNQQQKQAKILLQGEVVESH